MSLKDIRKLTIGQKTNLKTKSVTVCEGTDAAHEVMFQQPTRKEKKEIVNRCVTPEGEIDNIDLQTWAVILLARDPETGKQIFGEGDFDALSELPSGGWFEEYADHALKMISGFDGESSDPKESQEG